MRVAQLASFLKTLAEPLSGAGGKRIADDLRRAVAGFAPFAELSIAEFADFLTRAEEYHRTGIVPAQAKQTTRRTATADPQKVQRIAQQVLHLYERAVDQTLEYSAIEAEIKKIEKQLNKAEAVQLAREVGVSETPKTKKAAIEAVSAKVIERKESYERTRF